MIIWGCYCLLYTQKLVFFNLSFPFLLEFLFLFLRPICDFHSPVKPMTSQPWFREFFSYPLTRSHSHLPAAAAAVAACAHARRRPSGRSPPPAPPSGAPWQREHQSPSAPASCVAGPAHPPRHHLLHSRRPHCAAARAVPGATAAIVVGEQGRFFSKC